MIKLAGRFEEQNRILQLDIKQWGQHDDFGKSLWVSVATGDEMRSSALLNSWRDTYTRPAPCTAQPPPSDCANSWRFLLTRDDAFVAVLALITQLLPGITGIQQSGGQFLQRKKTSALCISTCSGAGQG